LTAAWRDAIKKQEEPYRHVGFHLLKTSEAGFFGTIGVDIFPESFRIS